jgi:NIMA (never in mitosis gene a)-related kinase
LTKDSHLKIGDLGVAKILTNAENFVKSKVGTPYYLSPEVCEDKPYNNKSDIWSLGCILYELCSLKHPFQASNQAALLLKIIKGKYESIPKKYSKELEDIVHSCLMKDYKKRPSIEEIILHSTFQKQALILQIKLPINKKQQPVTLTGGDKLNVQSTPQDDLQKYLNKSTISLSNLKNV